MPAPSAFRRCASLSRTGRTGPNLLGLDDTRGILPVTLLAKEALALLEVLVLRAENRKLDVCVGHVFYRHVSGGLGRTARCCGGATGRAEGGEEERERERVELW